MTRHFLSLTDLGRDGMHAVLARAAELKRLRGTAAHPRSLEGKSIGILLEKSSTRTRVSFEVGIHELGGKAITLLSKEIQLGRGESLEDSGRLFSRYLHGIVYRTHGHERVETLAAHSTISVINGLSDTHHPCQILADLMTVQESIGEIDTVKVAWVGDGNNVSHSWIEAAGLLGFELRLACPPGYAPDAGIVSQARSLGARIELTADADEACRDADVITTDVWVSMGQEGETEKRRRIFGSYSVDARRMSLASARAVFLHCLPAHRGEEVAAEVIDGPRSRVWDEAENRLHTQKALLDHLLG